MLVIEGAIVTIDAMGRQRDIACKVMDKKADYIFALKGNHDRIETRRTTAIHDVQWLQQRHKWPGLNWVMDINHPRHAVCAAGSGSQHARVL